MTNYIKYSPNRIRIYPVSKSLSFLMVLVLSGLISFNTYADEVKAYSEQNPIEEHDKSLGRLVSLMRSQAFKNALKIINTDSEALKEAIKDPKGFFKSHQVPIDDDIGVTVTKGSWKICTITSGTMICYEFG